MIRPMSSLQRRSIGYVPRVGVSRALALMFMACTCVAMSPGVSAQQGSTTRIFHLRETAGIRRTEYPASVTFQMPKGALADVSHARIMNNSAEVAAQFTVRGSWDDGSVQTLDVDLNATLDPEEDRRYELQLGPGITSSAPPSRGLSVVDQPASSAGSISHKT